MGVHEDALVNGTKRHKVPNDIKNDITLIRYKIYNILGYCIMYFSSAYILYICNRLHNWQTVFRHRIICLIVYPPVLFYVRNT